MFNNNDAIKVYVAKAIYRDEFYRLNVFEGMTTVYCARRQAIEALYKTYRDDCFVWETDHVSEDDFAKAIEDEGFYILGEKACYSVTATNLELSGFFTYEIYRRERLDMTIEDIRCRYNGDESDIRDVARLVDHALDQSDSYNDVYWSTIEYFAAEAGLKEIEY